MESTNLLNCVFEVIAGTYEEFILGYIFKTEPNASSIKMSKFYNDSIVISVFRI